MSNMKDFSLQLIMPTGVYEEKPIKAGDAVMIGRATSELIDEFDKYNYVSRKHLVIKFDGENFLVEDMSTNGTFIGGRRLTKNMVYVYKAEDLQSIQLPIGIEIYVKWRLRL